MDDLTIGQLARLGLLAIFLPAQSILLLRHVTGRGTSSLLGSGRVAGTVAGLGTVFLVLGATLPIGEAAANGFMIAWAAALIAAAVIHRVSHDDAGEADAT